MRFHKVFCVATLALLAGCSFMPEKKQAEPKPLVKMSTELTAAEYAAWMAEYEPKLTQAIAGTSFELTRNQRSFMLTLPVDNAFNKDRPKMLLPATLGPITRVSKLLEKDNKTGVIILGHSDVSGSTVTNIQLSQDRAKAVAAIFNLAGVRHDRLLLLGMGEDKPRAGQKTAQDRAKNRRVELIITPKGTLSNTLAQYRSAPYGVLAANP